MYLDTLKAHKEAAYRGQSPSDSHFHSRNDSPAKTRFELPPPLWSSGPVEHIVVPEDSQEDSQSMQISLIYLYINRENENE